MSRSRYSGKGNLLCRWTTLFFRLNIKFDYNIFIFINLDDIQRKGKKSLPLDIFFEESPHSLLKGYSSDQLRELLDKIKGIAIQLYFLFNHSHYRS